MKWTNVSNCWQETRLCFQNIYGLHSVKELLVTQILTCMPGLLLNGCLVPMAQRTDGLKFFNTPARHFIQQHLLLRLLNSTSLAQLVFHRDFKNSVYLCSSRLRQFSNGAMRYDTVH